MTGSVMSGFSVILPAFGTFFIPAVLVVHIAASRTGNTAQCGSGKGILVEDDGSGHTGSRADGSTGDEMLFLGSTGAERKGKNCYGKRGKYSVHAFLEMRRGVMRVIGVSFGHF